MAKTTAPLLSFDAGGQIGKSMVFGNWRGVSYARRYAIPANPRTLAQQANRLAFATLREMWKRASATLRAPWDLYAKGRPFTGVNAFVGENRLAIQTGPTMEEFIASPGARGGVPAQAFGATTGSSSGEIDISFTAPAIPTDWTLEKYHVVAFKQQNYDARFESSFIELSLTAPTNAGSLSGLEAGETYVVAGYTEWTKADGTVAFGPSIVTTAAAGA